MIFRFSSVGHSDTKNLSESRIRPAKFPGSSDGFPIGSKDSPGRLLHKTTTLLLITFTVGLSIGSEKIGLCQAKRGAPNMLFILADDHAAHAVSAYSGRINQTPQIDRIARDGMRFDRCFCVNSICTPSRACILTGKYSHKNGVYTLNDRLDPKRLTRYLVRRLERLGHKVTLEPATTG